MAREETLVKVLLFEEFELSGIIEDSASIPLTSIDVMIIPDHHKSLIQ